MLVVVLDTGLTIGSTATSVDGGNVSVVDERGENTVVVVVVGTSAGRGILTVLPLVVVVATCRVSLLMVGIFDAAGLGWSKCVRPYTVGLEDWSTIRSEEGEEEPC